MRKSSLDMTRTRRSKHPFMRNLPEEPVVLTTTIGSENQHRYNFAKDERTLDLKRKHSTLQKDRHPSFLHQLRKLNSVSNTGKNVNKFSEILKKSSSSEIQQMIGTLVKKAPKNNEIQKMFARILKKQPTPPKRPKMKHKKTQTKPAKIPKSRSVSSMSKSQVNTKHVKKSSKTRKNLFSDPRRKKSSKADDKSLKSSSNASPFRVGSLGGQSLIFRTGETNRVSVYTTKSANNLEGQSEASTVLTPEPSFMKKRLTFLPKNLRNTLVNQLKRRIDNFRTEDNYIRSYSIASCENNAESQLRSQLDGDEAREQPIAIQIAKSEAPRKVKSMIGLNSSDPNSNDFFQTQERAMRNQHSLEQGGFGLGEHMVESLIQDSTGVRPESSANNFCSIQHNEQFLSKQTQMSLESGVSFRKLPQSKEQSKENTMDRKLNIQRAYSGSGADNDPTLPNSLIRNDQDLLQNKPIMDLLKNVLKNDREVEKFYRRNAEHLRAFLDSQKRFYYDEIIKKTFVGDKLCEPCHEKLGFEVDSNNKLHWHKSQSPDSLYSTLKSRPLKIENNLSYMTTWDTQCTPRHMVDAQHDPRTPSTRTVHGHTQTCHFTLDAWHGPRTPSTRTVHEHTQTFAMTADAWHNPKTPSQRTINFSNQITNITNLYFASKSQNDSMAQTPSRGYMSGYTSGFYQSRRTGSVGETVNPHNSRQSSCVRKRRPNKREFSLENQPSFYKQKGPRRRRKEFTIQNLPSITKSTPHQAKIYRKKQSQLGKNGARADGRLDRE